MGPLCKIIWLSSNMVWSIIITKMPFPFNSIFYLKNQRTIQVIHNKSIQSISISLYSFAGYNLNILIVNQLCTVANFINIHRTIFNWYYVTGRIQIPVALLTSVSVLWAIISEVVPFLAKYFTITIVFQYFTKYFINQYK